MFVLRFWNQNLFGNLMLIACLSVGMSIGNTAISADELAAPGEKKASATILDVVEESEPPEARLLGPLEESPPPARNVPSGPVLLKPIPIQDNDTQPPPRVPTRSLPTPQPRSKTVPHEPSEQTHVDGPNLSSPPVIIPMPSAPAAIPAARYWVASSRCCSQKRHKCGMNCRFVCHRADGCHLVPASPEEMFGSLIPGAPTCIFVHGSYMQMSDVAEDAEHTYRWLCSACPQVPLNFIYFTWPSEGQLSVVPGNPYLTPIPAVDMAILGRRAEANGFYLADLVGCLPPQSCVCLLGHSLGTRTIASGLHLLGGGTIHDQPRWNSVDGGQRLRAVLAAAAIEHDWFNPGDKYGCALRRTECLLNLRNEKDLALFFYPFRHPFSGRSLARAGFTRKDHRKLGDHTCQIKELDVTCWMKHHHTWPRYVARPEIAAAVAPYVFFDSYGATVTVVE